MVVFIARFISRVNDELMVCCHGKFIAIRMSSYQFLSQIRLRWIAHCTEIHFIMSNHMEYPCIDGWFV